MKQNSDEWLQWRKEGLGASDAPIVMGKSPYETPYGLFLLKTGLKENSAGNYATNLGHTFEEPALNMFCLQTGIDMEPDCVEHAQIPQLRASLDGLNLEKKLFLELKYMGDKNLSLVESTKKPLDHHHDQVQHQFMVTGFEKAYYAAYGLDQTKENITRLVSIEVFPEWEYIEKILAPKLLDFLNLVKTQTPPPLCAKDILVERDVMNVAMVRRWKELKKQVSAAETEILRIETHLKKLTNTHPLVKCGDVVIKKSVRKGSINYAAVPELESVNLEAYRKAPVTLISMKEGKHDEDDL